MKKIFAAAVAVVLLASCQESILYKAGLDKAGVVTIQSSATKEIGCFLEGDGPATLTFESSKKVSSDVEVNFEFDATEEAVQEYNRKYGTNYQLLPEENYDPESFYAVIPAGSAVSEPVSVEITVDGLGISSGIIYCLPVKLTGTNSSITTIPGEQYAYIVVRGYVYASAAALSGSGSYFDMPSTVSAPALELKQCTMEMRVKVNRWQSSNPYISSLIGVEENFLMRFGDISCDPNQLQLAGQGVSLTSKAHFELNKWYHVAVVADGVKQNCKMYINGELDSDQSMGAKGINLGQVYNSIFAIGMSEKGRYLNGYVSEARIWNRCLSQTELINGQCSIANPRKEAAENGLLGYWKLDAVNKGKDLSGNGYDGGAHNVSYTEANIRCPED